MNQRQLKYGKKSIVCKRIILFVLLMSCLQTLQAQKQSPAIIRAVNLPQQDLFGARGQFIQNLGQYGDYVKGQESLGKILFAYEGLSMPVLFTEKGIIHLQRKIRSLSHEEEERLERKGIPEEEIENKREITDRMISLQWLQVNPDAQIIPGEKLSAYHTYASVSGKAYSYKSITWKNRWPGIDLVLHFTDAAKPGFEFSFIVHPGARLTDLQWEYGGDIRSLQTDAAGQLIIHSPIENVFTGLPQSYYGDTITSGKTLLKTAYRITGHRVQFYFPQGTDSTRSLVIDPFVTATGNLTGLNAGKAKDVDFDYNGNIYVTGGGNSTVHQLAKYDASGALQWTFNGTLAVPSWSFGSYWGGWMVEKPTGNIYLGQGFNPTTGFQVIRVSTNGLYDNFITTANASFREAWKMYWSCNNGSPQILVAGGGTNSNINFGVFTPPSTTISSLNVTGIAYTGAAGWAQDIVDFIIDPSNNDMYTIYGSLIGNPSLTNRIYKNVAPYSGGTVAWNVASGFTAVQEIANRPYLLGGQIDNSANIFAVNSSWLFYWDGKNLKAFDKATGATVGTPLTTANTVLMQGGVVADACNNVFVGDGNGVIKVYKFDGSTFNDGAAADITIPGFAGRSVYDLAYDESKKLLYASGDGFVTAVDVSAYCPTTQYTLNVAPDCVNASATITVSPAPPAGSVINYVLYNGTTQVATNTTGLFTGLSPNTGYTVIATINLACSGTQATVSFTMPGAAISTSLTHTTCGNNTGVIQVTATGATAPYTYSLNGGAFQSSNTFNALAAGSYTVTVKDASGCISTKTVVILNSNGPVVTATQAGAGCGLSNGSVTVTVTGGTSPYQYSINGGTYQNSNFFTGLTGGVYTVTVKDAAGCTNDAQITVTSTPSPQITATPASATCGNNNGTITAFGSGGTPPLQYSINGNSYQASNFFTNLAPGVYTVTVKDVNGCLLTTTVTVANAPAPTVTAVATSAACANFNGSVTATGNGGIAPYQYSIDGVSFQIGNVFSGLGPGTYTITIKDNSGCTATTSVTVVSGNGPSVSAVSTTSSCASSTGTITVSATGGTPAYQYSLNAVLFQLSNVFTALAPGNYNVYVKDAAGCITATTVVVSATAGPQLTVSVTPTVCVANTGVITITGAGGTPPYTYSLDGVTYVASNVFSGLATGIFTVYIKDANGCIKQTSATVTNGSGLTLSAASISSSCGGPTGVITATASGGAAPLQYSINGVTYQAGNVFSGLAPGVYTVYVKDANGCITTAPVTVTSASGLLLTASILQNATCGGSNAVVRVNGSGGVAPLTYNIDGGAFQSVNIFIGIAAGTHTVSVKDASGCTVSQTVTITNSNAGTVPTDVTFNVKDALACTGSLGRIKNLKGVPSGGGNNYTFSLDGGAFTTANQFTNVTPGVHVITARNQSGCTVSKLVTIGSGTAATATATSTATPCGTSNGTITITGIGPNTPYHASIDGGITWNTFFPPGANSFTFTGLAAGTYTIIMADDADFITGPPDIPGACLTTIFVAVPSTGGPSVSTTQINPTCSSQGSITANGSGGTPPYQYSINGGTYFSSGVFNNLTPGVYAVTVMDATGCTTGANITLANPAVPAVTATVLNASCALNDGTITANGSGGTGALTYSINGTVFQSSSVFNNLGAGIYTVYVQDASGCYGTTTVTVSNTPVPVVTAFSVPASCGNNDGSITASAAGGTTPYTYSLNGTVYQSSGSFTALAGGFYTVYMKDARGCIVTTGLSVANSSAPVISASAATAATCGNANGTITITATGGAAPLQYSIDGINYQSGNVFSGLISGTYIITVKDANGCMATKAVVITNTTGPSVLSALVLDAACGQPNGSITANASGGLAPYQYSINGTTYQPGTVFNALPAGNYTLYVKDANGCIRTTAVTVANLSGPVPVLSASPASCGGLSDGTITVTVTGGTGAVTYSLDGIVFQANNVFTGLAAGAYTVTVKDSRGCTGTAPVTIGSAGVLVTPQFTPVAPVCAGTVLSPLPVLSLNGIAGTWSPALNNTSTTTYTFTPAAGLCASPVTLTITILPKPGVIVITHN